MTRDAIATDKLAAPVGPFSLGVRGVGLLFLSGQVAQDPATGKLIDGDVARQTHQILGNIAKALETVGKDLGDVLRVGVYLTDISDFRAFAMLPRIWWVWRATSPSISLPVAGSWATCPLRNSSPTPRTPSENGPTGAASLSVAIASRVMVNESFHLRRWLHRGRPR